MCRAEGFNASVDSRRQVFAEICRVQGLATNDTPQQFHGNHLFPGAFEETAELHGLLRADPPAVSTPCTESHVVEEFPLVSIIHVVQCAGRTVLHACQASIASFIDTKVGHRSTSLHGGHRDLVPDRLVQFERGLNHPPMKDPLDRLILDSLRLAHGRALGVTGAKVTLVG